MPERSIEDRLREEYFDLLPEIKRVVWQLEAEVRFHTLPILHDLKTPEQLIIKSRIKDCESAIETLKRISGEGRKFDAERAAEYTLLQLPDLAGVRVLVFPDRRLKEVDDLLQEHFSDWTAKPILYNEKSSLVPKYYGYCRAQNNERLSNVLGEYQVVPMLLGLFWEVEHAAMYKLRAVANSKEMKDRRTAVEKSLADFEQGVERYL